MTGAAARVWAPLRRRSYRALATSLTCSLFATGAWMLAAVWQVLALGGGVVDVSVVSATSSAAAVLTFLFGGVLADRLPAHRLLTVVETVRTGTAGTVAVASATGHLTHGHLVVAALVQGVVSGLFLPSYSAMLVRVLDPSELQAANGFEGMLRPVLTQAVGPAVGGALVAAWSPAAAVGASALGAAAAALAASRLPRTPPAVAGPILADLAGGMRHVLGSRWLLTTLLYSSVATLQVMGPMEVLTPFAVRGAGGGPAQHALVLGALGVGATCGSLAFLAVPMPRRYLSTMMICWALACLPLAVFGLVPSVAAMVAAGFVIGALFNAPMVIWSTVLQRRVPRALLGRVSGLDFFVSLGLLPVSIALAGPVGTRIGFDATFLVAATVPAVLALVAIAAGGLRADEVAHPLPSAPRATAPETGSTPR